MNTLIRAKISSVGQITLPSAIRKLIGVKAGDEIELVADDGVVFMKKPETLEENISRVSRELDELNQTLPDNVKENIKKYAGWTVSQYREYYDNLPETKKKIRAQYGF